MAQQRETFWDCMRQLNIPKERWNYQLFLSSRYWWLCKQEVLKRDRGQCQRCGTDNRLHVHHKTYEHHGDELNHLDDLVTLCRDCHALEHGLPWKARNEPGYPTESFALTGAIAAMAWGSTPGGRS